MIIVVIIGIGIRGNKRRYCMIIDVGNYCDSSLPALSVDMELDDINTSTGRGEDVELLIRDS
jgi:hypothetical protein